MNENEADKMKRLRKALGLSQRRLAEQLGVTTATVGRWECGLRQPSPLAFRAVELLAEVNKLRGEHDERSK